MFNNLHKLHSHAFVTFQHTIGSSERGIKDGSFQEAQFSSPQGLVHQDNFLYIADTNNHAVRRVRELPSQ